MSWNDAKAYTVWLSKRTGKAYRLLTEAEWEYAARAGTTTRRFWGDDGDQSCGYANGADLTTKAQVPGYDQPLAADCYDRYAYTAPVGSYLANAFGLYDMLGNVSEWTEDCGADCSLRVLRGGSWSAIPKYMRSAFHSRFSTGIRFSTLGFRVARDN